jgi:hypothetical protein
LFVRIALLILFHAYSGQQSDLNQISYLLSSTDKSQHCRSEETTLWVTYYFHHFYNLLQNTDKLFVLRGNHLNRLLLKSNNISCFLLEEHFRLVISHAVVLEKKYENVLNNYKARADILDF